MKDSKNEKTELSIILSGAYGRYEELLVERERMVKAAGVQKLRYIACYGDLLTAIEEERCACIRIRRCLDYCEKAAASGGAISAASLQSYLTGRMKSYEENLRQMRSTLSGSRHLTVSTGIRVQKVKRWYRILVRRLHPDFHPDTRKDPTLSGLWDQVVVAFQENDLDGLQELDLKLSSYLADDGLEELPIELDDLPGRIDKVKDEIDAIEKSDPYQYRFLLDDPDAAREKGRELEAELASYRRHHDALSRTFSKYLADHHLELVWTV